MSSERKLGRILNISLGHGGYDDAMFGVTICLGSDSWGITDFKGTWTMEPDEHSCWTVEDQTKLWGDTMRWLAKLMAAANAKNLADLKDTPVEIALEGNMLKDWRVLTEVIR